MQSRAKRKRGGRRQTSSSSRRRRRQRRARQRKRCVPAVCARSARMSHVPHVPQSPLAARYSLPVSAAPVFQPGACTNSPRAALARALGSVDAKRGRAAPLTRTPRKPAPGSIVFKKIWPARAHHVGGTPGCRHCHTCPTPSPALPPLAPPTSMLLIALHAAAVLVGRNRV